MTRDNRSTVAVLKTAPQTVIQDYGKLMRLAGYQNYLRKDRLTILKVNVSWHRFYPACSTTPWQLDGVIRTLLDDGYDKNLLCACHNRTVVVDDKRGEMANKHRQIVVDKYGIRNVHLYEEEWVPFKPKGEMRTLREIFPDGIKVPKLFIGSNIIHLPTMKTHVFTTMTGAMKNAFGGLLQERRHWTHSVIHETLVDLLTIQQEIHAGIFAVMDGTFAGDGAGPRCMAPHVKEYILASADQVAIDAVAAKMMGFDPRSLDFIRLAHERRLGCGAVNDVNIVGEDITGINFHFRSNVRTFASRGQHAIYHGPLKPLERLLLRSPVVPWSYVASRLYHDVFWYWFIGRKRVNAALKTEWGKLFEQYR